MTPTTQERIFLSPPFMMGKERELLLDAFDSNWIAPLGPHVDAFEIEFSQRVGMKYAVALSSGTASLHLALKLLGIGHGDTVITSSFTFAATANAITYVGAEPIFVDSDETNWNLDPALVVQALEDGAKAGKLPRAVIAVDILGQTAAYDPIKKACNAYGVPIIEDAAEALGATYDNKQAGSFGAVGCFSFNGNKIITAGGGGMLVTNNAQWAEQARFLATQAREPAPYYEHSQIGYNYRMSNLLAAVGRGQLEMLNVHIQRRRAIFNRYKRELGDLPGVGFMPEPEGYESTRWLSVMTIDPAAFGVSCNDVRLSLESQNVESQRAWKPMHQQPIFANCKMYGGSICERFFEQGLCLPSGTSLSEEQQMRVINIIQGLHAT